MNLTELLARLLSFSGYEVHRAEAGSLMAFKGSLGVYYRVCPGPPTEADVAAVLDEGAKEGAERFILVTPRDAPPDVMALEERPRLLIWDRARLIEGLGRMLLAAAEGQGVPDEVEALIASLAGMPPAPHGQASVPAVHLNMREGVLRPRLDSAAAGAEAAPTVGTPLKLELLLVPCPLYSYTCEVEGVGRTGPLLRVDGLSGEVCPVEDPGDVLPSLDEPHTRLEPALEPVAAESRVRDHIVRLHTRSGVAVSETPEATVHSKVMVAPDPASVQIYPAGTLHLPVWRVTGPGGVALIDAASGKTLRTERA